MVSGGDGVRWNLTKRETSLSSLSHESAFESILDPDNAMESCNVIKTLD